MSFMLQRRWVCHTVLALFGCSMLLPAAGAQTGKEAEGAQLFASSGCAHCHGATGEGTDSGPTLRGVRKKLKAAEIQQQIANGGGAMPAFGDVLDAEQIKALVAMLRSKTWVPAPASAPPPAGKQIGQSWH